MNATKGLSVADNRGVLPMIISETGADDEPEIERIICVAISGGADYLNDMPRELTLERITPQESIFARYIQTDQGTRWGRQPALPAEGEVAELMAMLIQEAGSIEACCSKIVNGECRTLACLQRGGYVRSDGPPDSSVATCPTLEKAVAMRRAAALLAQCHPAPVPVSERLPGLGDCALWPDEPEATPWCWAGKDIDGGWEWAQISMLGLGTDTLSRIIAGGGWTHWHPANALPLPAAEVQP